MVTQLLPKEAFSSAPQPYPLYILPGVYQYPQVKSILNILYNYSYRVLCSLHGFLMGSGIIFFSLEGERKENCGNSRLASLCPATESANVTSD